MRSIKILCLITLLAGTCFGQILDQVNSHPLELGTGSRPLAMGQAFSGLDDVNSNFYNPAGLAWSKGIVLNLKDTENLSVAQAFPSGKNSSIGLAVFANKYNHLGITPTIEASIASTAVTLGFGTKLTFIPALANNSFFQKFALGLNLKSLMNQTFRQTGQADLSANGIDLDAGVLWKGAEWWNLGFTLENLLSANVLGGGILKWNNGVNEGFPFSAKLAYAARVMGDLNEPIYIEDKNLLIAGELVYKQNVPVMLRLGGELGFNGQNFLRFGLAQQQKQNSVLTGLSFGVGTRSEDWGADLAAYQDAVIDQQVFSLSFLYFPKEWVVVEKLDLKKPSVIGEHPFDSLSLEDNVVTTDENIKVGGKVKPGVSVYVNNEPVALSADNNFNALVPLRVGKNLILVEARYEGEKKLWKFKVLRKAKVIIVEEKKVTQAIAMAKSPAEKQVLENKLKDIVDTRNKAESLVTMGIIEISGEAQFSMEAGITRGELATWLVKSLSWRIMKPTKDLYPDVLKDDPLAPYIAVAVDLKILEAYPDGTFRPNECVSKEEGQAIFARFGAKQ